MTGMFEECSKLKTLDLTTFDTSNVKYASHMFDGCTTLESLDLSSFDITAMESHNFMFANCDELKTLAIGEKFSEIDAYMKLHNGGWANKNAPDVCISGSGEFAVISNSGRNTYIFTGKQTHVTVGDSNSDGDVNTADLVTISSFILGKKDASTISNEGSDINGDGVIDIFDIVALRKLLIKKD
jgi:surface protein